MVLLYDVSVSNTYTHNPPLPNDLQLQVGITGEPSSEFCRRMQTKSRAVLSRESSVKRIPNG